jgi:hypothetical protein
MNDDQRRMRVFDLNIKTAADIERSMPALKEMYPDFSEAYTVLVHFPAGWNKVPYPHFVFMAPYPTEAIAIEAMGVVTDLHVKKRAEIARKAFVPGGQKSAETLKRIDAEAWRVEVKRLW